MDSKAIGTAIIFIGAALLLYELYSSYCSDRLPLLCFFPFSPSEPGISLPLYPFLIIAFGLLVHFGSIEKKG